MISRNGRRVVAIVGDSSLSRQEGGERKDDDNNNTDEVDRKEYEN